MTTALNNQVTITTKRCYHCGKTGELTLDFHEAEFGEMARARGGLIQECYPNMSKDKREQIISGTHPECWIEMFSFDGECDE